MFSIGKILSIVLLNIFMIMLMVKIEGSKHEDVHLRQIKTYRNIYWMFTPLDHGWNIYNFLHSPFDNFILKVFWCFLRRKKDVNFGLIFHFLSRFFSQFNGLFCYLCQGLPYTSYVCLRDRVWVCVCVWVCVRVCVCVCVSLCFIIPALVITCDWNILFCWKIV